MEVSQHANDLLMNLWGESGLPILFLCHLGTAPSLDYVFVRTSLVA